MKTIILILVMLSLVPLAFAQISDDDRNEMVASIMLAGWWENNETEDNSTFQNEGSASAGFTHITDTSGCITGNCVYVDGENDQIEYDAGAGEYDTWVNVSLSCWIQTNATDGDSTQNVYTSHINDGDLGDVESGTFRTLYDNDNLNEFIELRHDDYSVTPVGGELPDVEDTLQMITWVFNKTGDTVDIFLNDTDNTSTQGVIGTVVMNTIGRTMHFGAFRSGSGNGYKGTLDECELYNISLNTDQIQFKFDENVAGRHVQVASVDVTAPVVSLIAPTPDNNSFSTSIIQVFNLSVVESNLDTITLNFNGTNETGFVNDFSNFFSLTRNTMAEGLFTYQIHVNDTSGNEFVSDLLQFTVDNTSPTIVYTVPTPDNLTVQTDLTGSIDILGFNINLDSANLTITNSTDVIIFQNITSAINSDSFTYSNSFSEIFTNQADGTYTFRTCFIDSVDVETCEEVDMELLLFVAPAAITAAAVLPLENASNLVGMVALFLIVLGLLGFTFTGTKK